MSTGITTKSSLKSFLQSKTDQGHTHSHVKSYLNLAGISNDSPSRKKILPSQKMNESDLLKLITYLQLSIKRHIPNLTIYAHLIKHGWDKMLLEKAYAIALDALKAYDTTYLNNSPVLKKDTKHLLSQIDELSAQISLIKVKIKHSQDTLDETNKKKFKSIIRKKYITGHFYSKTKKELLYNEKKSSAPTSNSAKKMVKEIADIRNELNSKSKQNPPTSDKSNYISLDSSTKTDEPEDSVKNQLAQVADVAKKSSSYSKNDIPAAELTINAGSINMVDKDGNSLGSRNVTNNYLDEGGELGLYNPLNEKKIEFVTSPVGDRVPIGIPDLDGVISGGLKPQTTTLVSGGAGTGKSTFGLQYLVSGIINNHEPGVYITFEQTRQAVISLGEQFGWNLEHLVEEGMLIIHEYTPEQISKALQAGGGSIRDMVDSIKAKRIVVDSITEYKMLFHSEIDQRKELTTIFKSFSKWGCTTIMIGQEHNDSKSHTSSVLDYESDAVILLYNERRGDIRQRSLEIYKMRDTKHAGRIFPMELTNNGMLVHTKKSVLVAGRR